MNDRTHQRILVIDDQEAVHEDYRKIFRPRAAEAAELDDAAESLFDVAPHESDEAPLSDVRIDSAYQGIDGVESVRKALDEGDPYSLAFVDIRMPPGLDGVETVSRIWEIDPEILVVLCSAYSDYSWEQMLRRLQKNDRFLVLKKPFDNIEVRQLALALTTKWHQARTDVLTGLLNRRSFADHFQREWEQSRRQGYPLSCVLIDIDFFKSVNDIHGHSHGDAVLKSVARTVESQSRMGDYVCRYGGEEICCLLPYADERDAAAWADRVRRLVESTEVPSQNNEAIHVTVSIGVAQREPDIETAETLFSRADEAMLLAKHTGRNRVVGFGARNELLQSRHSDEARQEDLFESMTAADAMTAPIAVLKQNTTIGEATEFFIEARINSAPVVDDNRKLVGILSEKDILWNVLHADCWRQPVSDVMQRSVVSYPEETPLLTIFAFLCRVSIRRVVIVRDDTPVGVISRGNLLRWFMNWTISRQGPLHREVHSSRGIIVDQAVEQLFETASALSERAKQLVAELSQREPDGDLLSPLVSGASNIQELTNDLLAFSRKVNLLSAAYRHSPLDQQEESHGHPLAGRTPLAP